jgi:hypothetical protein
MYAATTKDKGNAADGRFSTACKDLTPIPLGFDAAKEEVKILHQTVGHKSSILPILIEHP